MDRKIIIFGLLAVGALFLMPKKKHRRRVKALSGFDPRKTNLVAYRLPNNEILYVDPKPIPYEVRGTYASWKGTQYRSYRSDGSSSGYIRDKDLERYPKIKQGKTIPEQTSFTERSQMTLFGISAKSLSKRKICRADVTNKKIHCRVQNPKEFGAFFMRESTTPGVKYVMGMPPGTEKAVLQSVLFDKKIWDTRQAKIWFNRNIDRLLQRDKKTLRMSGLTPLPKKNWFIDNDDCKWKNYTAKAKKALGIKGKGGIKVCKVVDDEGYTHYLRQDQINVLMQPIQQRLFGLGGAKWKKTHDEEYFSPRQKEMFPVKRTLVLTSDDEPDEVSILSRDPLEDCLKKRGWDSGKVRKLQESISAKLTMDMFGKTEILSKDETRLQDTIQNCMERMRK